MKLTTVGRVLLVLVWASQLGACVTLPGYRQVIEEDDFSLQITAPDKATWRQIRTNPTQTAITALPEHTQIRIEAGDRTLTIQGSGDAPTYDYEIDGKPAAFDAEAQQWLGAQLPRIVEKAGLETQAR